uniref:Serine/threonine protein phosphatase 7 long form isogeny n=1 Tax=Cajanus cajan TaxID=3821 RepID=A0A151SUT9_CAJCA|nr:Serine/threonine protein phosphatase 7 long form isogeny [Cajanus cajan]
MQSVHVSQHVWNKEKDRRLVIRRASPTNKGIEGVPHQIVPFLEQAGFVWLARMSFIKINPGLISALVERWRPETHTFHMPFGECTITLQDVALLVGLPVDGLPLLGYVSADWRALCEELLGIRPTEIKGGKIKLSWLEKNFTNVEDHVNDVEKLRRYARAWILRFIGGVIFVDRSSSYVPLRFLQFLRDFEVTRTYAWGAAALSYLYRQLCTATEYACSSIGGLTILLQLWAWERFKMIAPKVSPSIPDASPVGMRWSQHGLGINARDDLVYYRKKFDQMKRNYIDWQPYPKSLIEQMPLICTEGMAIWGVMRQFGFQQPIPQAPSQVVDLHGLTLRGKEHENWFRILAPALQHWEMRRKLHFQPTALQVGLLSPNSDYMRWYKLKTKLYIDPNEAHFSVMTDVGELLAYMASPEGRSMWTVENLMEQANRILTISNEHERVTESAAPAPPAATRVEVPSCHVPASCKELGGFQRRRKAVEPQEYTFPVMPERQQGLYYVPSQHSYYPSQEQSTYWYPPPPVANAFVTDTTPAPPNPNMMSQLFGNSPSPAQTPVAAQHSGTQKTATTPALPNPNMMLQLFGNSPSPALTPAEAQHSGTPHTPLAQHSIEKLDNTT